MVIAAVLVNLTVLDAILTIGIDTTANPIMGVQGVRDPTDAPDMGEVEEMEEEEEEEEEEMVAVDGRQGAALILAVRAMGEIPRKDTPATFRNCALPTIYEGNYTAWQWLNSSQTATRLAQVIAQDDKLLGMLNSTKANYTIFAPADSAMSDLLEDQPSREALRQILRYHLLPGLFPLNTIKAQQTLPTLLTSPDLGKDVPQRLKVEVNGAHLLLNSVSQILEGSVHVSNGIIHQIDKLLIPPTNTSELFARYTQHLSTFILGLERTGLMAQFTEGRRRGGTTYVPSNDAFEALGPEANAFLFSLRGRKVLLKLLQYHIVAGQTLYFDTLSDCDGTVCDLQIVGSRGYPRPVHLELNTLAQKKVSVDLMRKGDEQEVVMRVNGFGRVRLRDMLAKDGVMHVLDRVLIPPRTVGVKEEWRDESLEEEFITVEILQERLGEDVGERDIWSVEEL
ncbi:hypothetical protein N7462_005781 [Penicillium macrosclerotiorum]|uniref:uncharacterized protein n=1 Tax=Penicillium macrosclerotiorum TaxID=303699 RepID=UPI00254831CD|nr:uncharacterized protein N7462_005781 [Penicillium macrosclerotiorum]KAJ5682616.1 hypothetical protein N7462_005781 [Penicillium macrosclerotiorum]